MNTLILVLATALLAQAVGEPIPGIPSKAAGDPIPGLEGKPGTVAAKSKHDTAKNAIGNVRAEASDPIPGVTTPTTRHVEAKPAPCVATAEKACPPAPAK